LVERPQRSCRPLRHRGGEQNQWYAYARRRRIAHVDDSPPGEAAELLSGAAEKARLHPSRCDVADLVPAARRPAELPNDVADEDQLAVRLEREVVRGVARRDPDTLPRPKVEADAGAARTPA